MRKIKTTETNFGKIVEEISTCKLDFTQTHIYIFKPVEEIEDYLLSIVRKVPADKINSYMIHFDNKVENLLDFFAYKMFSNEL